MRAGRPIERKGVFGKIQKVMVQYPEGMPVAQAARAGLSSLERDAQQQTLKGNYFVGKILLPPGEIQLLEVKAQGQPTRLKGQPIRDYIAKQIGVPSEIIVLNPDELKNLTNNIFSVQINGPAFGAAVTKTKELRAKKEKQAEMQRQKIEENKKRMRAVKMAAVEEIQDDPREIEAKNKVNFLKAYFETYLELKPKKDEPSVKRFIESLTYTKEKSHQELLFDYQQAEKNLEVIGRLEAEEDNINKKLMDKKILSPFVLKGEARKMMADLDKMMDRLKKDYEKHKVGETAGKPNRPTTETGQKAQAKYNALSAERQKLYQEFFGATRGLTSLLTHDELYKRLITLQEKLAVAVSDPVGIYQRGIFGAATTSFRGLEAIINTLEPKVSAAARVDHTPQAVQLRIRPPSPGKKS